MAGPDRIEWRRGFPDRALRLLGWQAAAGGLAVGAAYALFGDEPAKLNDGSTNGLATVPLWTLLAAAVVVLVALLPVVRRPSVTATHYALSVRPGVLRTLLLPWASIAEVLALTTGGEEFLLVRLRRGLDALGDRPTWWDQAVLRAARRSYPRAVEYDLAVRMRDFAGPPPGKLALLAAYAPENVQLADRL
jgi:hypothetical protein